MGAVRAKAMALTGLFIDLVMESCAAFGIGLASPREPERRGGQVALTHAEGYAIVQALIAEEVIGDFRAPDILRFGFAPLYVSFAETAEAARRLHAILASERWRAPEFQARHKVT
jgi:kynureninase